MRTQNHAWLGLLAVAGMAAGCADESAKADPTQGNQALGIAEFVAEDSADRTTVRGLDEQGQEVARLELVHGRFTVSPAFAQDFATPTIDGRRLDVVVDEQKLAWETEGYEPVLQLPSHPASQVKLAAFLADPHVAPVLARWQIGFEPFEGPEAAAIAELAYHWTTGSYSGTSITDCSNSTSCGSITGKGTIGMCGGGGETAFAAKRATISYSGISQYKIAQCCPAWFGIKTCPLSGNTSQCGTGSSACKGCPAYPIAIDGQGYCDVTSSGSTVSWEYWTCEPAVEGCW